LDFCPSMRYLLTLSILLGSLLVQAQDSAWANLSMVNKKTEYDTNFGMEIEVIEPGIIAQQLNNTEVKVSGYIIPLTGKIEQSHFMFSRYPQNMCFFCGLAGPESAMQVFTKDEKKLKFTEDKIRLTGTLQINQDEASGLIYTLRNATVIKED